MHQSTARKIVRSLRRVKWGGASERTCYPNGNTCTKSVSKKGNRDSRSCLLVFLSWRVPMMGHSLETTDQLIGTICNSGVIVSRTNLALMAADPAHFIQR